MKIRYFHILLNKKQPPTNKSISSRASKSKKAKKVSESNPDENANVVIRKAVCECSSNQEKLNSYTTKKVDEEFFSVLKDCYEDIETYLNKNPTVVKALTDWPAIFISESMKCCFRQKKKADIHAVG